MKFFSLACRDYMLLANENKDTKHLLLDVLVGSYRLVAGGWIEHRYGNHQRHKSKFLGNSL